MTILLLNKIKSRRRKKCSVGIREGKTKWRQKGQTKQPLVSQLFFVERFLFYAPWPLKQLVLESVVKTMRILFTERTTFSEDFDGRRK